jgi:hypothetical protein
MTTTQIQSPSMEDCQFKVSYDDFVMIWMGAGVGYFLIGYLFAQCCYQYFPRLRPPEQNVLIAREIIIPEET